MDKIKDYILLHICVMIFSLTSVFSKSAANALNAGGIQNPMVYVFMFLMLLVCVIYAFFWQKIIKKFDLNIGYANRSVYLLWGQLWAAVIFGEHLTVRNLIGVAVVLIGVIIVSMSAENK